MSASSSGDQATITFSWVSEGSGPLLTMALPHHMDVLQAPATKGIRFVEDTALALLCNCPVAGVLDEPYSQLTPLNRVSVQARQSI